MLEMIMQAVAWATANGPQFVTAVNAVLLAVIALCMMIPGEQPEKFLQGIVDFLSKLSKK